VTYGELDIRVATDEDFSAIGRMLTVAFNDSPSDDAEQDRVEHGIFEADRSLVAVDGSDIVGHAAAFTRDMTVPGAVLPAAHVTMVGVLPTYTRRGLLRRMMTRQLRDVRAAGEPFAVLWASEGRIYQRFGYGMAAPKLGFDIDTREVRLPDPDPAAGPSRLRAVDLAAAQPELSKVYEQLRTDRPGWSSRDDRWWAYVLSDPASRRDGATPRRVLLHEGSSGVDGYALWRGKSSWNDGGPSGDVTVREVATTTLTGYLAIWRFMLAVDLTRSTKYWLGSLDEPLLYLANEPRRLGARFGDGLWVRVVDVGSALAGRRYQAPVDVVIEVADAMLPENAGRWRLVAGPDGTTCQRTAAEADLACDISALGAAYLGGPTLGALAVAGRVTELRAGTLAAASAAFGWHRAPSGTEIF
jgi:predicted acetyltransferase